MIEIKNVSKAYVKHKNVIEKMNLTIEDGQIFGFIGPNGAGKTTTMEMLTGILDIDEGEILIDGINIEKNPIEAKKQFGFVPDSPDAFEKITKLAKGFGIYDSLKERVQSYSHGMKQKIIIIGVLLHNPKNWILDEPMTGLDPKASFQLKELMKEHSKNGNTVFFSTHVLEVAEKICDKIAVIDKGSIKFVGTCEELREKWKSNSSLEELFLKIIEE